MNKISSSKDATFLREGVGGKALGLLFLEKNKFVTPSFYLLDFELLQKAEQQNGLLNELIENWKHSYSIGNDQLWAIRSSAAAEDGKSKSFAGQYTTVTNVKTDDIEAAIKSVLQSYYTISKNYENTTPEKFGIIIQEMVVAEYSGVAFSCNPLDEEDKNIYINLVPGLGENLVSGKEEACAFYVEKGQIRYNSPLNDFYYGEVYADGLKRISCSAEELKQTIHSYVFQLSDGVARLKKLKKYDIDVEFCIAKNKLYWLQVRPVTALGAGDYSVWDNTACEANYPGITLPLSVSLVKDSMNYAYSGMGKFLGMPASMLHSNKELLSNMSGEINGAIYYNVSSWQKLIYQLPFGKKLSKNLPKIWGMEEACFKPLKNKVNPIVKSKLLINLLLSLLFANKYRKKYLVNFNALLNEYKSINLQSKSYDELVALFKSVQNRLGNNWEAPMINGFFAAIFFSSLKKIVSKSRLNDEHPNFINDILFSQQDIISVTIVRQFQKLLSGISSDQEVFKLFLTEEPDRIWQKLPACNKQIAEQIKTYIDLYGERSEDGELKMETINYKENPLLFIAFLKSNLNAAFNKKKLPPFDYNHVLKEQYGVNILKRMILLFFIKQTIHRVRDRENYRFNRTQAFAYVRQIFRAIDENLYERKIIINKGDSLYLKLEELIAGPAVYAFEKIISERKAQYELYRQMSRENRYEQKGNEFMAVKNVTEPDSDIELKGTGCCSGLVKGVVTIIDGSIASGESFSRKILIADYFEPGKINLFSEAAGIISARGNLLSHTAIICRELGIPSIVGVKGLMNKVKNGDIVEMDGARGYIKIITGNESF